MIDECILDNGGIVVGFWLLEIGSGVDTSDRSVVRLSGQLVVDRNEKIISDIGRIAVELSKGLDDKWG